MPNVRPADVHDAAAVAAIARSVHALHAAALPDTFQPPAESVATAAEMAALLARPGHLLLVATDGDAVVGDAVVGDAVVGDAVVGYAHAEEQRAPATPIKRAAALLHVHAMGVAEAHRGRGVGHALLAALREVAAARALDGLSLEVYAFNAAARAFYAAARAFYAREGFVGHRERMVHVAPRP